jgi:hypothetical protein
VLYIHVIQSRALPFHMYSTYLSAATRCQSHLSDIAEKGSLSERYCLVLEELRVEAMRQASQPRHTAGDGSFAPANKENIRNGYSNARTHFPASPETTFYSTALSQAQAGIPCDAQTSPHTTATSYSGSLEGSAVGFAPDTNGNEIQGLSLSRSSSDCPGWGQFTSIISSGLGNMDLFWGDEGLRL